MAMRYRRDTITAVTAPLHIEEIPGLATVAGEIRHIDVTIIGCRDKTS